MPAVGVGISPAFVALRRGAGAAGQSALYQSLEAGDYWALDEASGTRASAFNSEPLTDNNTVGSGAGLAYANAAAFVSVNSEYLSRTSSTAAQAGDIQFWASLWVRPSSVSGTRSLFSKIGSGSDREYDLQMVGSTSFRWFVTATAGLWDGDVEKSLTIAVDTWYWVCVWHDPTANTLNMQVNDLSLASAAYASGIRAAANPFNLGAWGNANQFFDGRIGSVGIGKNYIPTADDRAFLYNGGSGRTLAEVEAYSG